MLAVAFLGLVKDVLEKKPASSLVTSKGLVDATDVLIGLNVLLVLAGANGSWPQKSSWAGADQGCCCLEESGQCDRHRVWVVMK